MAHYRISHVTTFQYSHPVAVSHHSSFLKPLSNHEQCCHEFSLSINPESQDMIEVIDYFGNVSQLFSIQELHDELIVESRSVVSVNRPTIALESIQLSCREVNAFICKMPYDHIDDARQFMYPTEITPDLDSVCEFGQRFFQDDQPLGKCVSNMLQAFKDEFQFDNTATDVNTPITESLAQKRGVCQDFTHLMIAAIRSCGLSAQYCSGYILTDPPTGQARLAGADASHAWLAIYVPEIGWLQVDPTNNVVCDDRYVLVSKARDYSDITMLKGAVTGGGQHSLKVGVTMLPIDELGA